MVDALKRLDKKFLIFGGLIIGLPILIIIFLAIIQGCGDNKVTYSQYEKKMISALETYIEKEKVTPVKEGELVTVSLDSLVDGGYIKSSSKLLGDSTCDGSVSVRRNGSSVESTNGGFLNYTVNLECDEYSTVHLVDKLKEDIVSNESGLYVDGNGYIFKGNKVKNYITFFGHSYRIMSIDENNILKLIKSESEAVNRMWDNKFNVETNRTTGKNIYKDSLMIDVLLSDYNNTKKISTKAKHHVVAYDVCTGKRASNNYSIDSSVDCTEKIEDQVISILSLSDYAKASLDVDCTNLKSRSCNNYNYLYDVASSTWTSNVSVDNTYEVYCLSNGLMEVQEARDYNSYNIVIYVDGNTLYTSGNGTIASPFVIE